MGDIVRKATCRPPGGSARLSVLQRWTPFPEVRTVCAGWRADPRRWGERDEERVERPGSRRVRRALCGRGGRGRPRASRVHDPAPGIRAAARAARRGQHVGQGSGPRRDRRRTRRPLREGERVGHGGHRAAGAPRRAARSAARAGRDRGAVRRGHGQSAAPQPARLEGAEPVRRDAAARVGAAHVHRPHARQRGARAHGPAARGGDLPRSLRRQGGDRPLHHAGLRSRQGREGGGRRPPGGGRTRAPQARAVHLRGYGEGGVRADDRVREPRRGPDRARAQEGARRRRTPRAARLRERHRADHPRPAGEPAGRRR